MLMKVFEYGKGRGELAINYLITEDYANRHTPPLILRGDHKLTTDLINSLDTVWKYTSGVLSWHPDDEINEEQERALMNDFEKMAFAGLEPDQYNILWVHHSHAGHHELHFVIPRMELSTGKAFNPCPPNWRKDFDPLRDFYNIQENWARPDDPERARLYTPPHAEIQYNRMKRRGKEIKKTEINEIREALIDYIVKRIKSGLIENRNDIINSFQDLGFSISRQGKNYITIHETTSEKRIRFKGGIFNETWRLTAENAREIARRPEDDTKYRASELERLTKELAEIYAKRSAYNRGRYRKNKDEEQFINENELEDVSFSSDMLTFPDIGNIPSRRGSVPLSDKENQQFEDGTGSTGESDGNSTDKASEHTNMGNRITIQRERGFYNPPSWSEDRFRTEMDTQNRRWNTTSHQTREGREYNMVTYITGTRNNSDNTIEINNIIKKDEGHYERDTRIPTENIYTARTEYCSYTEKTFPRFTATSNRNTKSQEGVERLAQSMQDTSQSITKLEHGIQELRSLIERFKEYLGGKSFGERIKQHIDSNAVAEQKKHLTQNTHHEQIDIQEPRRMRF